MVKRNATVRMRAVGLIFFIVAGGMVIASRATHVAANNPLGLKGLQAVSCPAVNYCVAGGVDDMAVLFDGVWWIGAPSVAGLNPPAQSGSPRIEAVSCAAVDACVAVGNYDDANGTTHGLIENLNGGIWTATTAPLAGLSPAADGTWADLGSVSCPAVENCIAVGAYNAVASVVGGLIETLSGGTWSATTAPVAGLSPPASGPGNLLNVYCPDAGWCVAVGFYQASGGAEGVIETLSSGTWTAATAPVAGLSPPVGAGAETPRLTLVTCAAAGSCEAVGIYTDTSGHQQGLFEALSSGTWAATTTPTSGVPPGADPFTFLTGISCPATGSCTAVGSAGNDVIETLSGGTWTALPVPLDGLSTAPDGYGSQLNALSCAAVGTCVAVGSYNVPMYSNPQSFGSTAGLIETLSGGTWTATAAPTSGLSPSPTPDPNNVPTAIACAAVDACAAVGSYSAANGSLNPGLMETLSGGTWSATSLNDPGSCGAVPSAPSSTSTQQYQLHGSDGVTWQPLDPNTMCMTVAATKPETVLVSGTADLWVGAAGTNQDLGITVSDNGSAEELLAWKESGGNAGAGSPNAAHVQWLYSMNPGHTYVFMLSWKANQPSVGPIYAGAGPIVGAFSPTSLLAQPFPTGAPNFVAITTQPRLTNSDGATWQTLDPALHTTLAPASNSTAVLGLNADLWTSAAGYNQDIGIFVSDNGDAEQLVTWKESGGFAGTYSPNAVFATATLPMNSGHTYVFTVKWKTNINTNGSGATIWAGAGPLGHEFSPTDLLVEPVAAVDAAQAAVITSQPRLMNSDGGAWQPMDAALSLSASPRATGLVLLTANADLWTDTAGYNQDIGLFVSDGGGPDRLIAWKESGGFAGTFSPNAAFVQAGFGLESGHTYVFTVKWKANRSAPGATIYAGAGPIGGLFSPTRLAVETI